MRILFTVIGGLVLLITIVLLRALSLKPTPALTAKMPEIDEKRADEYGKKLSEMIKIETVSDRDNFDNEKFKVYQNKLKELFPLVFSTLEIINIDGNLLAKWKGKTDKSAVLLMSHQDVVSADGEWLHEPFGGEIADGKVWGRGAGDTKCSALGFLQAAEELIKEGFVPETDIYLAGSNTEEISGDGAIKTVAWLKERNVSISLVLDEGGAILDEPIGGVKGMYAMVGILEKGYGDVKFTAKGKGGHASKPPKDTPWERIGAFIYSITKKPPFKSKFNDLVLEMFRRLTPNMGFGMRVIFANMWLFKPLLTKLLGVISPVGGAMLKTTIAFTKGEGSQGYNVLPLEAYVTANLRFIPHQNKDESLEILRQRAKKFDIEMEVLQAKNASRPISYNSNAFHLVEEATQSIFPNVGVVPYVMTVGTDAKDYEEICPNCLRFFPFHLSDEQMNSMHAENENIDLEALVPAVDFYKYIIRNSEKASE